MEKTTIHLNIEDAQNIAQIFGSLDKNVKKIEEEYNVKIRAGQNDIDICGDEKDVEDAKKVILSLNTLAQKNVDIDPSHINYSINLINSDEEEDIAELLNENIVFTAMGKPVRPKTHGQKRYVKEIYNNDIVFGIGPAGTGKTYLAMATAVRAFKTKQVNRIILTRPAVEAGESLGFLPGDLQNKVDPYLRPLYDALFEILGAETYNSYLEKGLIEVAPLAYMRGRTLDSAFVILDEAQNTTNEQMKMFLTRLGYGSKAIITGDVTQIDLPKGKKSGLKTVLEILKGVEGISMVRLGKNDIVRHPLVQRIISAYDKYEEQREKNKR